MAKLLIGIVIAVGVNSLEWGGSNKDSFWSYYEAVGDFIKTNPVATYAKESLEDLHEYLVEEDVYGKAYKIAHDIKDYTADSVEKLRKHGESLSSELKDAAKEYYHEAKTSAKELYEISKDSALKFTDYAQKYTKESLEDLHEYLVEEDVYGKAYKLANDIKDYSADSVDKLRKHGETLGSELKDAAKEYYQEAKTSAKQFYETSKDSAFKFRDYAQEAAYKFKEYSSDLYNNSKRSTYEFIEVARSYTKYPINMIKEYLAQTLRGIQDSDYYKAARKATIDFKEYAKNHPYTRSSADSLYYSFDVLSAAYKQAKEVFNNNSAHQAIEDSVKVAYEFIMNDILSNAIEYFDYGVNFIKESVLNSLLGLNYQSNEKNEEADKSVIYNMSNEKLNLILNFHGIDESNVVGQLGCNDNFSDASHIKSCKTKPFINTTIYFYPFYIFDGLAIANSHIQTLLHLYSNLYSYLESIYSLIWNLFKDIEYKFASIILSLYENLSYESIFLLIRQNYEDISAIYQTHSFKDFLVIYCKKFKNLSTRTLSNFIGTIKKVFNIELPTSYIDRLISLFSRFDYLKLYRILKDLAKHILGGQDIYLNESPLNYLGNAVEFAIKGGIANIFTRLGIDFMIDKLDISITPYMSKILNKMSKSGVYSGSKEVLKISIRAVSYGLEVISIDRLSDILNIINRDDEFYGIFKINPFDILIPSIVLALSALVFGPSATLSFSVAQLVSEVIASILFPQPKPIPEVCDYKDHTIQYLLYFDKSHCLPRSPHKSSKSTRCSDYLKRVSHRFYTLYKDVSKFRYYRLPIDLVDSILDSDTYYSECF